MEFTRADLLVDISEKELEPLTRKLVEAGDPDPVGSTIAEQDARIERYVHVYVIDEDWRKTILRALVIWRLCQRISNIPPKRQASYDEAMKELIAIRDGKFEDLPIKTPPPDDLPVWRGKWGGKKRIF
jgi:hypothetical protein